MDRCVRTHARRARRVWVALIVSGRLPRSGKLELPAPCFFLAFRRSSPHHVERSGTAADGRRAPVLGPVHGCARRTHHARRRGCVAIQGRGRTKLGGGLRCVGLRVRREPARAALVHGRRHARERHAARSAFAATRRVLPARSCGGRRARGGRHVGGVRARRAGICGIASISWQRPGKSLDRTLRIRRWRRVDLAVLRRGGGGLVAQAHARSAPK